MKFVGIIQLQISGVVLESELLGPCGKGFKVEKIHRILTVIEITNNPLHT
jgi:hypothetical protein